MLSTYEFAALQVELNPTKYGTTYYQEGNDSDEFLIVIKLWKTT